MKETHNVVDAFNNGDANAFKTIYNNYHRSLLFIACKYLHNKDDATALATDCLLKLWQHRGGFQSEEHIKGYLFNSIRHACINHLRNIKRQTRREQEVARMAERDEESFKIIEIEAEVYELILNAIETLPSKCRCIFKLLISGKSAEEIACRLNLSVKTVYAQKRIATQRLRQIALKNMLLFLLGFSN